MRIGIVKPDYAIVGGFERVMSRIADELTDRGHRVEWRLVDVSKLGRTPFGVGIPDDIWEAQPEFFRYVALLEEFARLRVSDFDLVLSTQPPSFAVEHERHLALFSHHHRIYYDLADVFLEAGFADVPAVFDGARRLVRRLDQEYITQPQRILAASEVVKDRLREYNGLDATVGVYHAGVGVPSRDDHGDVSFDEPLCVSRHEFPKRTELFVHAMRLLPGMVGTCVGGGGRLGYVRALDARLSRMGDGLADLDDRELWLCRHDGATDAEEPATAATRFVGYVDDDELQRMYARALCVVAPAYLEDYGLTAIEAMTYGKPLIVCKDGGGLTAFVEDGVNGFVVEPTGEAIASAIRMLHEDRSLARRLGDAARETAARFTWARAMEEIDDGIRRVMDA